MKIKLKTDTGCAHDEHEMTYYPRPHYKVKPILKKDTLLDVQERWMNFYGQYYRCRTQDGLYDIPIDKAVIVEH